MGFIFVTHVKNFLDENILRRSVERDNIIKYKYNEGNNTRRVRKNNQRRRNPDNNQEMV